MAGIEHDGDSGGTRLPQELTQQFFLALAIEIDALQNFEPDFSERLRHRARIICRIRQRAHVNISAVANDQGYLRAGADAGACSVGRKQLEPGARGLLRPIPLSYFGGRITAVSKSLRARA